MIENGNFPFGRPCVLRFSRYYTWRMAQIGYSYVAVATRISWKKHKRRYFAFCLSGKCQKATNSKKRPFADHNNKNPSVGRAILSDAHNGTFERENN